MGLGGSGLVGHVRCKAARPDQPTAAIGKYFPVHLGDDEAIDEVWGRLSLYYKELLILTFAGMIELILSCWKEMHL